MLEFLYQAIYILIIAMAILDFAIARIMRFFHIGESTILAPVIGTALGLLVYWVSPTSIAGLIVGAASTIICNLVLSKAIYPKLGDKVDALAEKNKTSSLNNDFDRALHSPTAEERVKYLCRNMRSNYPYCFRYSGDTALVYQRVKGAIDNSDLRADYPEVKFVYGDAKRGMVFNINTDSQAAGISFTPATINDKAVFMLGTYVYADEGNLRERIALEKRFGFFLDKLYMLVKEAIQSIDANCTVDIVPFKLPR